MSEKKKYVGPKLEELSPIDPRVLRVRLADWAADVNATFGRISPDHKETWVALHKLLEPMERFVVDVVKDAREVEAEAVVKALKEMHAQRRWADSGWAVQQALLLELVGLFERGGHRATAEPHLETHLERMAKELTPSAMDYLRKMRAEIDSIEQVMLKERRQAMENTMVKMALGIAEKHGAKLKELAERAAKGEGVAAELSVLSVEFQSSLEVLRKAAS